MTTPRAAAERIGAGFTARRRLLEPLGVATVASAGCAVIWLGDPTVPGGFLPVCPTKALLHIDCPGCGTMRAIYSLLHGNLPAALHFNAVAVVAIVVVVVAFGQRCRTLWTGNRGRRWQDLRYAPHVVLVVVVGWFIVRNLPFAPFTSLKV